ncbi:MAG TPA: class I SAM-dependent methyltransferase [Pyrinomonadaceae bacterium]|nr:class I SAM-dependent methyltransferase [Acidobacteriota bacterium]HQZ95323.1 class I SAM-dependent methyltransferase [Pyrinomonadaceae bacterium]
MAEWDGYILTDYRFEFLPGSVILDVGCGSGHQLSELQNTEANAFGVDIDQDSLNVCRERGLNIAAGEAERLPYQDEAFDGILCKVVLSYTDDRKAVAEIARTLRPGATAYIVTHGAGYYLTYFLKNRSLATRFYGLRSLVNTMFFSLTGKRLPGFLGDTIYQSERLLSQLYTANGLELTSTSSSKGPFGYPVFIYHKIIRKR